MSRAGKNIKNIVNEHRSHRDISPMQMDAESTSDADIVDQLQKKVKVLKAELEQRSTAVTAIQRNFEGLSNMIKEERNITIELKRVNTDLVNENQKLKKQYQEAQNSIKRLTDKASADRIETDRLKKEAEDLQAQKKQLGSVSKDQAKLTKLLAEREKQNAAYQKEIETHKKARLEKESEVVSYRKEIASLNQLLDNRNAEVMQLNDEVENLTALLEQSDTRHEEFQEEIKAQKKNLAEKDFAIHSLKHELKSTQQMSQNAVQDLKDSQSEKEALRQRLEKLNELITSSSANEDLLKEQMAKFQGKSSDFEGQLSALSNENRTKEMEIKRLQEAKEAEIQRLQEAKEAETKRLQQEHSNMSSEMQKVMVENEEKVEQLLRAIANNENSLGGKDRVLMDLQAKIEEYENIVLQQSNAEQQLRDETGLLQNNLNQQIAREKEMQNVNDLLQNKISKLNEKIHHLENSNSSLKRKSEDTSTSDSLTTALLKAKEKKNQLKSQIHSTFKNLQDIEGKLATTEQEKIATEKEKLAQLAKLNKELQESQNELKKKDEELGESSTQRSLLKNQIEDLEERKKNTETELEIIGANAKKNADTIMSMQDQHKYEIAKLNKEIDDERSGSTSAQETLSRRISEIKTKLDEAQASLKRFDGSDIQMTAANKEIERLKTQLSNKSTECDEIQMTLTLEKQSNGKTQREIAELQSVISQLKEREESTKSKQQHMAQKEASLGVVIENLDRAKQAMETELCCEYCFNVLDDAMTCYPCGHNFCTKCEQGYLPYCAKWGSEKNITTRMPNKLLDQIIGKLTYERQQIDALKL